MQLLSADKLGMLLGLSFFFGLSFEGFYWNSARSRPGGIRTFPLISLSGAILYALESQFTAAFCVGLIVLGVWLYPYYRAEVASEQAADHDADGLMVPLCNVMAYLLGPVALTQPPWVAFGLTVSAVLLLRARDPLHALAERIPGQEIITLAQFLVLTGVVLPLLPNKPVTSLTPITPFQVWLAVVVVSSLSYGSYLLQKLCSAQGSLFFTSVLGGLYSSTATTVVLARRLKQDPHNSREFQSGIVLATAMMYLRLGVVLAIFNVPLALELAGPLVVLAFSGVALAALCLWLGKRAEDGETTAPPEAKNPLELPAALIFAVLFVVISGGSSWVKARFGQVGIYWLAALVGVTDIDPFVLSVAQGGVAGLDNGATAIAILVAASSNNVLKAGYAVAFAGWRRSLGVVLSLVVLGLLGCGIAVWLTYRGPDEQDATAGRSLREGRWVDCAGSFHRLVHLGEVNLRYQTCPPRRGGPTVSDLSTSERWTYGRSVSRRESGSWTRLGESGFTKPAMIVSQESPPRPLPSPTLPLRGRMKCRPGRTLKATMSV